MVWVDYLIIGIILVSSGISIVRGFIKEVLSLVSWALSFWVALTFHPQLASLLVDYIATPSIRLFTAFFTLFLVTLILGTDRSLGIIFGLVRGVAIVTLLVLIAGATPMPEDSWWQASLLLEHFEKMAIWLQSLLPADIAEYIHFS